jgi:protein SCO1/2
MFLCLSMLLWVHTINAQVGGEFTLVDHTKKPFSLSDARGKVVIIFFGYTSCPDICPTELSNIARLLNALGDSASNVVPLFITLDPERDSPEKLAQYVPWFHPALIGLSGTVKQIRSLSKQYAVQFRLQKKAPDDLNYSLDHSTGLYLINKTGQLSQIIPYGLTLAHSLKSVKALLAH